MRNFNFNTNHKFMLNLLGNINNFLNNLTLENSDLVNFISQFECIDDQTNAIYWGLDISKCFYELVDLEVTEINILLDFLNYIKENLPPSELEICSEELIRAENDLNWLIKLNDLYENLDTVFDPEIKLKANEIIRPRYIEVDKSQEEFFIALFNNTAWRELKEKDIIHLLQGYEFYLLSDQAFLLALPASIKICIDLFKSNKLQDFLEDSFHFFLSFKNRTEFFEARVKEFINNLIYVMWDKADYMMEYNEEDFEKLLNAWK